VGKYDAGCASGYESLPGGWKKGVFHREFFSRGKLAARSGIKLALVQKSSGARLVYTWAPERVSFYTNELGYGSRKEPRLCVSFFGTEVILRGFTY